MDILQALDKGNRTIMRCRGTLARLINEFDSSGTQGTQQPLALPSWILDMADHCRDSSWSWIYARVVLVIPIQCVGVAAHGAGVVWFGGVVGSGA